MKKLFLLLVLVTACSSADNGAYTKSKLVKDNLTKSIAAPWIPVEDEGSDLALNNTITKSFFLFNSACRKNELSNLSVLTNSMLAGINNVEYIEKKQINFQDRDASMVIAKGSIDGIERYFRILTTQKNNCIYDFALIATSMANLNHDSNDFNNFSQLLKLN
ncbi:MAG: hypothetical protein H7336_12985 [Bacteriovorax sp.]|nr:hypothetical protein [Bacteriovorax sp.]